MTTLRSFCDDKVKNYQAYLELAKKYSPERVGYSFEGNTFDLQAKANAWFMFKYDPGNPIVQDKQATMREPFLVENSETEGESEGIFSRVHREIEDLPLFSEIHANALQQQISLGIIDANHYSHEYAGFKLHLSLREILKIPQDKINQLCDFLLAYTKVLFDFKIANFVDERSERKDHEQFAIFLNKYTRIVDIKIFMQEVEDFVSQKLGLEAHRRSNDKSYYKDVIIFNGYLSGRIDSSKLTQNYGRFQKVDVAFANLIKSSALDSLPIGFIDYIYNEVLMQGLTTMDDLNALVARIISNPQSFYEKIMDTPKIAQQRHEASKVGLFKKSELAEGTEIAQPSNLDFIKILDKVLSQLKHGSIARNKLVFKEDLIKYFLQFPDNLQQKFPLIAEFEKIIFDCLEVKESAGCCFTKPKITLGFDRAKFEKALGRQQVALTSKP